MSSIEIKCCEGKEENGTPCLKDRCPIYKKAANDVWKKWPQLETGFGNACGSPDHEDYMDQVRKNLDSQEFQGLIMPKKK